MSYVERRQRGRRRADGRARDGSSHDRRARQAWHDLRQEIALLLALTEVARSDPRLSPESQRRLDLATEQAMRLSDMLASFVTEQSVRRSVDVSHVVREVVCAARVACPTSIIGEIDDGVVIHTDRAMTRRAVMNVLDNAIRAAGPAGVVVVGVHRQFDGVVVSVEDSGPGFGEGPTGLASIGLSVARDWVDEVGGRLEVGQGRAGGALVQLLLGEDRTGVDRLESAR